MSGHGSRLSSNATSPIWWCSPKMPFSAWFCSAPDFNWDRMPKMVKGTTLLRAQSTMGRQS